MRYRAAVALYSLAAWLAGGVCLCDFCAAFARSGRTRRDWRQAIRAGARELQRHRPR